MLLLKLTKKTCGLMSRETKLLELIHSDLRDLKQTMTRQGHKFYVTLIDDYSRFTKVCLEIKIKHLICS